MTDPQTLALMLPLLLGVGLIAGVIAGLLGAGGGMVLVPALYYVFAHLGYDSPDLMRLCLATSLATIIVTSIRSLRAHDKRGALDRGILRQWAPGIAAGAILGVLTVSGLNNQPLQVVFGFLGLAIGGWLAFGNRDWVLAPKMPDNPKRSVMAGLVGYLSVLMGIGGGSFAVPIMTLHGQPIRRAVGTSSGFGLLIALPSALAFLLAPIPVEARPPFTLGSVNLAAFALIVAMTWLTVPLGARLAHGIDPRLLRRIFAGFITLVALNMLREAFGG